MEASSSCVKVVVELQILKSGRVHNVHASTVNPNLDDAQSVDCDCGEPQTMAHLLSCRLLDEACTADDLATVTEWAKACARKWEKNGQGLPPGRRRRLKKVVQGRGRRLRKLKLASLNVGSMTGRSGEIVQLMRKKSLQVLCVQDTKWKGSKAREIGLIGAGYKLYYYGEDGTKNGVGIVLSEDMRDRVLAVERTCDRVMRMKLEIEGEVWHIISCYEPQVGCTQEEKD